MTKYSTILISILVLSCSGPKERNEDTLAVETNQNSIPEFKSTLISESAELWWARALADIDGDGIQDLALINNNGSGGWLGYLKGRTDGELWETIIVAEASPNGLEFAAGDLEVGDIDGDGDTDLIGVEHTGEWEDALSQATLFWYEQSGEEWITHEIGSIPSFMKDMSLRDLDQDNIPEIVTVTFDAATLSVFKMIPGEEYQKVMELKIHNLHEGLDTGDLDGDGWVDISTNGYWLKNPGGFETEWELGTIDTIWNNQDGDWSRNATKVVCRDVDDDGRDEVFITHSERAGYPVAMYDLEEDFIWSKSVLMAGLPAAHNLQVEDINGDGKFEVLTAVNPNRAKNIEVNEFPVLLLENQNGSWNQHVISDKGSYNLLAGDIEGDGDIDLIRLTSHDEKDMHLMLNLLNESN